MSNDPARSSGNTLRAITDGNRGAPWWLVAVLVGGVGAGGVIGGGQLTQPSTHSFQDELKANTQAVQQVSVRLEALTGAVASLASQTGRDQARTDKVLDDLETRVRILEGRRVGR